MSDGPNNRAKCVHCRRRRVIVIQGHCRACSREVFDRWLATHRSGPRLAR